VGQNCRYHGNVDEKKGKKSSGDAGKLKHRSYEDKDGIKKICFRSLGQ
jgi:hypothetical protein